MLESVKGASTKYQIFLDQQSVDRKKKKVDSFSGSWIYCQNLHKEEVRQRVHGFCECYWKRKYLYSDSVKLMIRKERNNESIEKLRKMLKQQKQKKLVVADKKKGWKLITKILTLSWTCIILYWLYVQSCVCKYILYTQFWE